MHHTEAIYTKLQDRAALLTAYAGLSAQQTFGMDYWLDILTERPEKNMEEWSSYDEKYLLSRYSERQLRNLVPITEARLRECKVLRQVLEEAITGQLPSKTELDGSIYIWRGHPYSIGSRLLNHLTCRWLMWRCWTRQLLEDRLNEQYVRLQLCSALQRHILGLQRLIVVVKSKP